MHSRTTHPSDSANRDDCFLAALEQTLEQARALALEASADERDWRKRIRSALGRLLVLMEEEPALARLWVVEAVRGGEAVLERRAQALDALASAIDEGRDAGKGGREPPSVIAEGIVGGVLAVLYARLVRDAEEPLTDLLGPLMYMVVLPFLGAAQAGKELDGPPCQASPRIPGTRSVGQKSPLDGLSMRLTYRTARVLGVISERPGASNREVAEGSGVVDQGQISKLLGRLARLELVENHGLGQERGASNAWHLAPRGAEIVRATRSHERLIA